MPDARENYTYLITTSILDSFEWFNNCPPSWKDKAHKDILSSLRREPWKPHKSAKRGMEFEDMVYAHARLKKSTGGSRHFQEVVNKCRGGKFQQVLKKNIKVNGNNVVLYGKVDVLFEDRILDIKTTENYRGASKYLNGWQHLLYLYMSGLQDFSYLVVLFEEYPSLLIVDKYETPFHTDNPIDLLEDIEHGIMDLHDWIDSEGLWHDYEMKFSNNWKKAR